MRTISVHLVRTVPLAFAAGAGALLVEGHAVLAGVVAASPLAAVGAGGIAARVGRIPIPTRRVALILLLLLASTFVWRQRTTQALDSNPLDRTGLIRVLLVSLAGLACLATLASRAYVLGRIPVPLRFLGAYIVISLLSALGSAAPLQASYRSFELAVGFVAIIVASTTLGERAASTLLALVVGGIAVVTAVIWIEALVVPGRAWARTVSVVPYELNGYLPSVSSNGVGTFGAILAIWGVASPLAGRRGQQLALAALAFGGLTLLAAQYRTGIIGFSVAAVLTGWNRRRVVLVLIFIGAAFALSVVGTAHAKTQAVKIFSKGRPELVHNLDSRTTFWHAAQPLILDKPVFGWGLNVASRQVLVKLGDNTTSTIHSTWVEALLGTGFVGTSLLGLAFLSTFTRAWRSRAKPLGAAVLGLTAFYAVRSLTGTTTELFDTGTLVFATLALAADQLSLVATRRPEVGESRRPSFPMLVSRGDE